MSLGTLVLGSALLLLSAGLLTYCLRLRAAVDFVLTFYLVAFSIVVVVELLLSPGHDLTRTWLLGVLAVVTVGAGAIWFLRGRPSGPTFRPALAECRDAVRDPLVAILAVAVLGGFGYLVALVVGTPPNDYDTLWYHLARAAFWKQQHAIAYIPGANDARLNGFPPNAEIADSFTMILGRTERFAGFVQLTALVATMVAIAGTSRRLGLSVRQALFGALLFATLPVVLLQSGTSLNDLVFASFLACCAYFLFTWRPVSLVLASLALGLAIGTKITALLGLPLLALLGAFLYPRRRWPTLVLVGVAGSVLGSYWYLLNRAKTGKFDGNIANPQNATTVEHGNTYSFLGTIAHFLRLLIDAFDPSGAVGRDRFVYLVATALVLVLGWRVRGRLGTWTVAAAAGLVAVCVAWHWIDHGLLRAYQKLFVQLDRHDLAFLGFDKDLTRASPFQSWYGPLGYILVIAAFVVMWLARRRDSLPRAAWVLALAPVIWLVLQALTTFYSIFDGRYVVFAVALGAVLWGLVLDVRPLAWAVTGIAVTTAALVLVHYYEKPSGVNLLGGSSPTSVWDLSRAQVMSVNLPPGEPAVMAALDRRAKQGQTIALAIGREDVSYPFFGGDLDRHVVFVPRPKAGGLLAPPRVEWLVTAPGFDLYPPSPPSGFRLPWTRIVDDHGWVLYRHI
jgi:hypothetical protein